MVNSLTLYCTFAKTPLWFQSVILYFAFHVKPGLDKKQIITKVRLKIGLNQKPPICSLGDKCGATEHFLFAFRLLAELTHIAQEGAF